MTQWVGLQMFPAMDERALLQVVPIRVRMVARRCIACSPRSCFHPAREFASLRGIEFISMAVFSFWTVDVAEGVSKGMVRSRALL